MNKNKFDIVLIAPPTPYPLISHLYYTVAVIPPLGIGYLSSYLREKAGYKTLLLNLYPGIRNKKELLKIITDANPKIVGFSTMTETFKNGVRIAKEIKKVLKNVKIVFGGPHVTFLDKETLENYEDIDIIVRGEGEDTFLELACKILDGDGDLSNIKGITYRVEKRIFRNMSQSFIKDLDKLPFPDRDFVDIDGYYRIVKPAKMVITSRGCPGACRFCAATAMSGGRFRLRSIDNVMEEIMILTKDDEIKHIFFGDDTLTADVGRFLRLISELKRYNIKWHAESRVDIITKELCKEMKESGCVALQFGVESGSQEILDKVNKRISLTQIENAVKWATESGIRVICSMMIGIPGDTKKTIKDTIKFALYLQKKYGANIVMGCTVPYPGTYIFKYPEKCGIKKIHEKDFDKYNTDNPIMDLENISVKEIRKIFYDAVKALGENVDKDKELDRTEERLKVTLKIQNYFFNWNENHKN